MTNNFLRESSFYQRRLTPKKDYLQQSAFFISRMRGVSEEVARDYLRQHERLRKHRDPIVRFFHRPAFMDKHEERMPLSAYLGSIVSENLVMAPSLTCYVHPSVKASPLVGFTDENARVRGVAKKEAAQHKAKGDMIMYELKNGEQENRKTYNNALSGAFSSGGSIVRNPSAHSSLTSTTRTMTSIGNASNERMIAGNRHYRNPQVTLNNLVSIVKNSNYEEIEKAMKLYGLRNPEIHEVMECIEYSAKDYWIDHKKMKTIEVFVSKLTPLERSAVVYTGDLYHMRKYNEQVIRLFIDKLSKKVTDKTYEDPIKFVHSTYEMIVNYAHQICMDEVRGIGKEYKELSAESMNVLAGTCENITKTVEEYKELIQAFFLTTNMPPSVAYIRYVVRKSVILSDTDSTMFSCDEWVQWYYGDLQFSSDAFAKSGAVMFMATESIAHYLAIYSANMNVERARLHKAQMKPEYCFPIFALTPVTKHYFAYTSVKEGSVYRELEEEIKGVHLKNSASPRLVIQHGQSMMREILQDAMSGKKISLSKFITKTADLEREIVRSINAGEPVYLNRLNMKAANSYSQGPTESNFRYHLFWDQVFGPSYQNAPPPPYAMLKFPTILGNKTAMKKWAAEMEDQKLAARFLAWMEAGKKSNLNTLYVPQDYLEGYGTPKEIQGIIDIPGLVQEHTKTHRLAMASLGFYQKPGVTLMSIGY